MADEHEEIDEEEEDSFHVDGYFDPMVHDAPSGEYSESEDEEGIEWEKDESASALTTSSSSASAAAAAASAEDLAAAAGEEDLEGGEKSSKGLSVSALCHRAHVVCLLCRLVMLSNLCDDPKLHKELPPFLPKVLKEQLQEKGIVDTDCVSRLVLWMKENYKVNDDDYVAMKGRRNPLRSSIHSGEGSAESIPLLVAAILRSYGVSVRLVMALRPHSPSSKVSVSRKVPSKKSLEESEINSEAAKRRRKWEGSDTSFERRNSISAAAAAAGGGGGGADAARTPRGRKRASKSSQQDSSNTTLAPCLWLEFFEVASMRWVHVDPLESIIDQPRIYSDHGHSAPAYIVGVHNSRLIELSPRYFGSKCSPRWLEATFSALSWRQDDDETEELDRAVLSSLVDREPLPLTQQAYKRHPTYCLKKHIGKMSALNPAAEPIGFCGKEAVYLRAHIHPLKSQDHWIRHGRQVKSGEKPVRSAKRATRKKAADGGGGGGAAAAGGAGWGEQKDVDLFGLWQTERYEPLPVIDGKVPINEYGHCEIWTKENIPAGARHVDMPCAAAAAKTLGIQYAPAMVGFDTSQGKSFPMIRGVVVAEEFAEAIRAVATELEHTRREREKELRRRAIIKKWEKLAKALLRKDYIDEQFAKK